MGKFRDFGLEKFPRSLGTYCSPQEKEKEILNSKKYLGQNGKLYSKKKKNPPNSVNRDNREKSENMVF